MAGKSVVIIGAGMGGLASGIYGQRNGFQTRIFEMHTLPGGQWATSAGSLFSNALSGRTAIKAICRRQGKKFTPSP